MEKEWCAFGHKFAERCGIARDHNLKPNERSPVFAQFLEAVNYVRAQFPRAFEFSEDFLVFVADNAHSGLFGTFLGDTERDRKWVMRAPKRTVSIWTYVLNAPARAHYLNDTYQPFNGPLWPHVNPKRMVVWHKYYSRFDPTLHPATPMLCDVHWGADYGDYAVASALIDDGHDESDTDDDEGVRAASLSAASELGQEHYL